MNIFISTHTPVRVWHVKHSLAMIIAKYFNSHTREGVTCQQYLQITLTLTFQLTHPWGCDADIEEFKYMAANFNSHTREGVTIPGKVLERAFWDFNSHTREGVTYIRQSPKHGKNNFNSHTREGVTIFCKGYRHRWPISTHTPVRVWPNISDDDIDDMDFNSHTREGVTAVPGKGGKAHRFQLTHPWGCDVIWG